MKVNICHLYPDILNLYGDSGNILCMTHRLKERNIDFSVTPVSVGSSIDFSAFDLFFIGGGQDFEQKLLLDDLKSTGKAVGIIDAVENNKVFLCICGGFQMMGKYYVAPDGQKSDFLGAVDFYTLGGKKRMTGNYIFDCTEENGGHRIVGFENHAGKTYLGKNVAPLGKIVCGYGNNGEDKTEGVRYKNLFGTYCHGPLLPKNPGLCDEILLTAIKQKDSSFTLSPIDDTLENMAHDAAVKMFLK